MASYVDITMVWTPAHKGTEGNKAADTLAKEGGNLEQLQHLGLPRAELKRELINGVREKWDQHWERYPHARQTKYFYPTQNKALGKKAMELTRPKLGRYIRIVTGHNNLRYHRSNIDPDINPTCRFCEEVDETFIHFFQDCPALWQDRGEMDFAKPGGYLEFTSPDDLLEFSLQSARVNSALGKIETEEEGSEASQRADTEELSGSDADQVYNQASDSNAEQNEEEEEEELTE